ncbi:MAG: hypothetical protein OXG34_01885 [bacterium]|nr:hypothetical protein [bacterium]
MRAVISYVTDTFGPWVEITHKAEVATWYRSALPDVRWLDLRSLVGTWWLLAGSPWLGPVAVVNSIPGAGGRASGQLDHVDQLRGLQFDPRSCGGLAGA